ncbi:GAF domain-containing protein [Angustibacter luteus]|uniref:GAF domain-containing protein n=1 Tax=Angustibacter luteus TaxID=658456 RepID=A0ABW1JBT9_9ACTN
MPGSDVRQSREPWWTRRASGLALTSTAVVAAMATFLVSAQAALTRGQTRTWLLAVGAVLAGIAVLTNLLQQQRFRRQRQTLEQVAVDAEAALTLTINGVFAPITSYLGELVSTSSDADRAHVAGQVSQAVVDAAVTLTAAEARSAFYRLDGDGLGLTRESWGGRSMQPRPRFSGGTPDGDAVLDIVRQGDFVFVDDVAASPMVTPTTGSGYRTVVAVAVTAGPVPLGLLTVDAPGLGDLSEDDVELVRVLANLLGAAQGQL